MGGKMINETYYKKVGRRYVPVSYYDSDLTHALQDGCTLIVKNKGATSFIRNNITPDNAAIVAAMVYAKETLTKAMHAASEVRPARAPITDEELRAWGQLKAAMNEDAFYIQYPALYDIAEEATKKMQEVVDEMLKNDSVRQAYDHFLLVAKLSMENNHTK
jgi:hypothetical protein